MIVLNLTIGSFQQNYYLRDDRATCIVLWFIGLAFQDNAFQEYTSPANLFGQKNRSAIEKTVRFKKDIMDTPVLRNSFSSNVPWAFDSVNDLSKIIVRDAGFPQRFTFYAPRRGVSNKIADRKI